MEPNKRSSSQLSRVSSSSSSTSQPYELIPKQQPFPSPQPDLPSPRTSFPFRRVQPGFESSLSNPQSHENSRENIAQNSAQLIEAIGELESSKNLRQSKGKGHGSAINIETYQQKIKELERKLQLLEKERQGQKLDFQIEKKANEIYTDAFSKIRQLVMDQGILLEGEGIEELVQKISIIFQEKREGGAQRGEVVNDDFRWRELLEEKEMKIRDLRDELLKSSQNNINAIFNTEITQAHCLHLQIKKMNSQITTLKENLLKATLERTQPKVVNFHHQRKSSSDEQDSNKYSKIRRKRKNSSSSDSIEKSKILKKTEAKMSELLDGYKGLKEEYKNLQETLKVISGNQAESKQLFQTLKVDISQSLHQQIQEVKMTFQRPSSSHQQKQMAKDLQYKLNHLINTLNAPEKVKQERSSQFETSSQVYQNLQ